METVREKLMDELKSLDWYHVSGVTGRLVHGSNSGEVSYWKCADVMEALLRVLQDATDTNVGDKWVSVDERLPEESEYLKIGFDARKFYIRFEIAYKTDTIEYAIGYYDGFKWFDERNRFIKNVVGWRILETFPEPPKGVQ